MIFQEGQYLYYLSKASEYERRASGLLDEGYLSEAKGDLAAAYEYYSEAIDIAQSAHVSSSEAISGANRTLALYRKTKSKISKSYDR